MIGSPASGVSSRIMSWPTSPRVRTRTPLAASPTPTPADIFQLTSQSGDAAATVNAAQADAGEFECVADRAYLCDRTKAPQSISFVPAEAGEVATVSLSRVNHQHIKASGRAEQCPAGLRHLFASIAFSLQGGPSSKQSCPTGQRRTVWRQWARAWEPNPCPSDLHNLLWSRSRAATMPRQR